MQTQIQTINIVTDDKGNVTAVETHLNDCTVVRIWELDTKLKLSPAESESAKQSIVSVAPMSKDAIRDSFERDYLSGNKQTARRNEHGFYVLPSIQDAWSGWQAAYEFLFKQGA